MLNNRVSHDMPLTEAEWAAWRVDGPRLLLVSDEKEKEEEEETSSRWHAAPACLRQGYWYSLLVIVMLVRRLRQASSPGLRGSSGGDSLCGCWYVLSVETVRDEIQLTRDKNPQSCKEFCLSWIVSDNEVKKI